MTAGLQRLPLYLSAPHACSYLPGRSSSTLFADPDHPMTPDTYGELLRHGFRRSGRMVYTPRCEDCRQCMSVRVPVDAFTPRRNHRRILRANGGISVTARPAGFDDEHFALYQAYTRARHEDGDMADASPPDYLGFLTADWCDTVFLELRDADRLVAVAVTDRVPHALSAVYTFFDPDSQHLSPGTLAILMQIEQARAEGLDFLYLGYWIRDCRKMAYKVNFRPLQIWRRGNWEPLGVHQPAPDP